MYVVRTMCTCVCVSACVCECMCVYECVSVCVCGVNFGDLILHTGAKASELEKNPAFGIARSAIVANRCTNRSMVWIRQNPRPWMHASRSCHAVLPRGQCPLLYFVAAILFQSQKKPLLRQYYL